jgi:hypothetical protein
MTVRLSVVAFCGLLLATRLIAQDSGTENGLASHWKNTPDRVWVGPEFWANPMEDWRIQDGQLECIRGGVGRNVHVLTRQLNAQDGRLEMSVAAGVVEKGQQPGNVGFLIGIEDEIDDYRARLLRGKALFAGVSTEGKLRVGRDELELEGLADLKSFVLKLFLQQQEGTKPTIELTLLDGESGQKLAGLKSQAARNVVQGNLALVQNHGFQGRAMNRPTYWFRDWKMSGDKLTSHDDQTFGPILWAMHTLSNSRGDDGHVMKMTAQMPPVGRQDSQTVRLQVNQGGSWKTISEKSIEPLARTATFRVAKWKVGQDVPYQLAYTLLTKDGSKTEHFWTGTVRHEPRERDLVVAGFTGNTDSGFPNREVARNVAIHNPDVLFFSGDQIYESVGGFGIIRKPVEPAVLNYLRKWYLFGFAFRDLMRDRPTICLPDDHDVYQGNIWGNGGNSVPSIREHPEGGYAQHVDFVNAVHRTQCSHHPDLFDPTPIKQDMSVFYGDMVYGRVSFAILGDRMFKSGPTKVADWPGRPDHQKDPDYDVSKLDKPGLKLLGDRQEEFLEAWGKDWRGADQKCVLSQTIFCNLANYHGYNKEFIFADLDANGWPQSGRNRALSLMRKCFAFHYAGDQHLPSIVQHGIEEFGDAGYSFCVPSIAAGYPRSWRPDDEGRQVVNRPRRRLQNTGDYHDGFGNKMTVHAIGNPEAENRRGRLKTLHDKASGYGIVRFHKESGKITMECYRLLIDANELKPADQFPGWPKRIDVLDNYGQTAVAYLPTLKVAGLKNPVVQVIDEANDEIVYTVRIRGYEFRPKVFASGKYTVTLSDPDSGRERQLRSLEASQKTVPPVAIEF